MNQRESVLLHAHPAFGWLSQNDAKTAVDDWALENELCPVPEALRLAVKMRRAPLEYGEDQGILELAETFEEPVQRFADVLERELRNGDTGAVKAQGLPCCRHGG